MTFRRQFLQFSLRSMLLGMVLVAGVTGGIRMYQQREHRVLCEEFIGRTEFELRHYRDTPDMHGRDNFLTQIEWRVSKSVGSLRKEEWQRLESLVQAEKLREQRLRDEPRISNPLRGDR